jgi:hypothetical protein
MSNLRLMRFLAILAIAFLVVAFRACASVVSYVRGPSESESACKKLVTADQLQRLTGQEWEVRADHAWEDGCALVFILRGDPFTELGADRVSIDFNVRRPGPSGGGDAWLEEEKRYHYRFVQNQVSEADLGAEAFVVSSNLPREEVLRQREAARRDSNIYSLPTLGKHLFANPGCARVELAVDVISVPLESKWEQFVAELRPNVREGCRYRDAKPAR